MRCKGVPELCSSTESRSVFTLALNWIMIATILIFMVMIFHLGISPQDDHAKVDVEGGGGTDKGPRKELS